MKCLKCKGSGIVKEFTDCNVFEKWYTCKIGIRLSQRVAEIIARQYSLKYIKDLLAGRKVEVQSGIILIAEEGWYVFDYHEKSIGVDPSAVVWTRISECEWERLGTCTVSNALQAIDYLVSK